MNDNDKTLQAYEEDAQGYIDKTPTAVSGDKKEWIERTLALIPKTARVLELGSGFGRDADYIESQGYKVQRSEAARSFIAIMEKQGHKPLLLNAITDDYGGPYDLIYANAVLLHFTPRETRAVLRHIRDALAEGGLFAVRLKAGEGSEWEGSMKQPRFMQYWRPYELKNVIAGGGFEIVDFTQGHSKFNKFAWLQIIARKAS